MDFLHVIGVPLAYPWSEPFLCHDTEAERVILIDESVGLFVCSATCSSYAETFAGGP